MCINKKIIALELLIWYDDKVTLEIKLFHTVCFREDKTKALLELREELEQQTKELGKLKSEVKLFQIFLLFLFKLFVSILEN